jgi:integrase
MIAGNGHLGALVVRVRSDGEPTYEAKWRVDGRQVKRRLGPAWIERGDASSAGVRRRTRHPGWIKRRGRPPEGWLTEDAAVQLMAQAIRAWVEEQAQEAEEKARPATFDDAASAWLEHRRTIKGLKRSTLIDYEALLRSKDARARKRGAKPKARIMQAFGGRPLDTITTEDVAAFLRRLDRDPDLSARTVNKHRQVLHAIFNYACRRDTFGLAVNPVRETEKRREPDEAELVTYSADEVEAIARALASGAHRDEDRPAKTNAEREARRWEDEQDACIVRIAAYCGLRQGELVALRWRHIMWNARRLHVQRNYLHGVETSPKGRDRRTVPLSDQAAQALARLSKRPMFTKPSDLVFCSRVGEYLDASALRRRYKAARDVVRAENPDVPALRFHDLRHTFGTLAAAGFDLVNVQAMMGHKDSRTTARYLHARPADEDAEKLSRIFAGGANLEPIEAQTIRR